MSLPNPSARPPARWGTTLLWILLVIALAGDAFFVGVSLKHGFPGRRPPPNGNGLTIGPGVYFSQLSPQTLAKVREAMRARHDTFNQQVAASISARNGVIDAMRAEPFDVAAYRKALEHSAEVDSLSRQQAIDFFATIVTYFTPEERKAIADSIDARMSKMGKRQGWRDRRGLGPWRQDGLPPGAPGPGGPPPMGSAPDAGPGGTMPAPPSADGDAAPPASPAP